MALQIPSTGAFIAVDTSTTSKIIQLPLTGERQGRVITIKDRTGQANKNPIIIQTTGQETFQDSSTSYKLSNSFDSVTFIASSGKWLLFSNSSESSSTIQGLGTLGFISSGTVNIISTAQLTSTIQGLGTLGYLSSAITNLSSIISTPQLTSSLQGLGTLGYISTPSLISTVASMSDHFTILSASVSSLNASNIYSVQSYISSLHVDSLQIGTGTGWVNFGAIQAVIVSTLEIDSGIIYGTTISSSRFVGDGSLLSNLTIPSVTPQLTSSLVGLGSMGYISSTQLTSTAQGLTTYINSFIDPQELASSITGLGTVQFISSIGLLSTSQGLADYITSFIDPLELASTVTGLGTAQYVSTTVTATNAIFTSSLMGLGSMGYLSSGTLEVISTPQLTSSLVGLGTLGYVSTPQLTSTTTGVYNYISTLISSAIQTVPIYYSGETLFLNLGVSSGISSYHSMQVVETLTTSRSTIVTVPRQTGTPNLATPLEQFITDFSIPSFIPQGFWDVNLFAQTDSAQTSVFSRLFLRSANVEYLITESIPSVLTFANLIAQYTLSMAVPYVSTMSGDKIVLKLFGLNNQNSQDHVITTFFQGQTYSHVHTTLTAITQDSVLTSTVAGLGTYGYISSSQLFSTVAGLGTLGYISSSDGLFSSIKGLGSMGYISSGTLDVVSTPQLTSSLQGLGSMGYLSSGVSNIISTPQLTSSLVGLGSMGYLSSGISNIISTPQLTSSLQGLGSMGYLSSGVSNIISTPQLTSSLQGLGSMGYLSSGISNIISTPQLTSSLVGLGTLGYLSSVPSTFISSATLLSSLQALGSMGYISSSQLTSTTQGLTTYINSFIDPLELASSITGLGTLQFISSIGLLSTSQGLANYITSFIDPQELASTVTGLGTAQYVSTTVTATNAIFTSSLVGLGSMGYISTQSLVSTVSSMADHFTILSAAVSSLNASNIYSLQGYFSSLTISSLTFGSGDGFLDFPDLRATSLSTLTLFTSTLNGEIPFSRSILQSTIIGLGTLGYFSSVITNLSSIISTPQLTSSLVGLGSMGYLSSGISNIISTPQLTSSLVGLGSMGYLSSGTINVISTPQLFSSLIGLGTLGYLSSSALCSFSTSLANPLGNFNVMSTGRTTASTITLFDTLNSNAGTDIYVRSTLLYFGGNVIGGTKVAQPQFFTF